MIIINSICGATHTEEDTVVLLDAITGLNMPSSSNWMLRGSICKSKQFNAHSSESRTVITLGSGFGCAPLFVSVRNTALEQKPTKDAKDLLYYESSSLRDHTVEHWMQMDFPWLSCGWWRYISRNYLACTIYFLLTNMTTLSLMNHWINLWN